MRDRPTGGQADWRTGVILSKRSAARGPMLFLATQLIDAIRKIAGMPNYASYVEHLRRFHPQATIPTERQYYAEFVQNRYGDGPTRCC
jgi:uncharacterized short protein YbdD (DUF466 family)